jgi:hypothetical protein
MVDSSAVFGVLHRVEALGLAVESTEPVDPDRVVAPDTRASRHRMG